MDCKEKLESNQCRTCYNATKGLKLLTKLTKCSGIQQQKSFSELITEVTSINIMEDSRKELPKFICEGCSRKLKAAHAFIQQIHEVNERLMAILANREEIDEQIVCLQEAQVDIQSCLEIKIEQDNGILDYESSSCSNFNLDMVKSEELVPNNILDADILCHMNDVVKMDTEDVKMDKQNEISILNAKMDVVIKRQDEIAKIIAENNALLQRNVRLYNSEDTIFPLDTKNGLKKLEMELNTDKRVAIITLLKRLLAGGIKHVDKIFSKNILYTYNLEGIRGKKPLKKYKNVLKAIYDSTKTEGRTYDEFIRELRICLHRIKNTINRSNSRNEKKKRIHMCPQGIIAKEEVEQN